MKDDLISRQVAIDTLRDGALINLQAAGHHNGLVKAIDVIKALPAAQPDPHWIPCSKRLPDKTGVYIVTEQNYGGQCEAPIHDVSVHTIYFYADDKEWGNSGRYYEDDVSNITAWMTLQPYCEKKEAE